MSEKRLLKCMVIEGVMLVVLSLCILIIPKLTMLSYGVMLAAVLIAYGIYKIINAFVNRTYSFSMPFCLMMGIFLTTIGVLILFVPRINLLWLIALIGVYFILESISAIIYALKLRNVYHFWGCKMFLAAILFLIGLFIILGVPVMSFWIVTVLSGIALLLKGMTKLILSLGNLCNFNM